MSKTSCQCGQKCDQTLYATLDEFIAGQPKGRDALIPVLHKAQEMFGYLPIEVQEHIAARLGLPSSEVYGVVTFYHYFSMQPRGRHTVNVCLGTACYVNGAEKVLQEFEHILGIHNGQLTPDGKFSLDSLRCVGACGLAPVVTINEKVYGKVQPGKVHDILEHYLVEIAGEEVPVYA